MLFFDPQELHNQERQRATNYTMLINNYMGRFPFMCSAHIPQTVIPCTSAYGLGFPVKAGACSSTCVCMDLDIQVCLYVYTERSCACNLIY